MHLLVLVVFRSVCGCAGLMVLVSFVGGSGEIGAQIAVNSRERFNGNVGCSAPSQIIVL